MFDKELKVLPAAGHRDPGSTFPETSPGPSPSQETPICQPPAQLPLPRSSGSV